MPDLSDVDEFEKEWVALAEEIVRQVFANPDIQAIKDSLRENGFLTLEEKSKFILITDKTKYDIIYQKFGPDGSPGYNKFLNFWQKWLKYRGTMRDKPDNMFEENINHFLFGSTPDPERFLQEYDFNN